MQVMNWPLTPNFSKFAPNLKYRQVTSHQILVLYLFCDLKA